MQGASKDLGTLSPPTYPSHFAPGRFGHNFGERSATTYDWIFISSEAAAQDAHVLESASPQMAPASDHKPVLATLVLQNLEPLAKEWTAPIGNHDNSGLGV